MAKAHKAQHWVPQSYLAAWTDRNTPSGQEPYVHVYSRDGLEHRRKAPINIFRETDLYTIKGPEGQRDLRLERGLSGLEKSFCEIRKEFLERRKVLPTARWARLLAFVAAMHARTPMMRDHHMKFWKEVAEAGEQIEKWAKTASDEQKRRAASASLPSRTGRSIDLDDVRAALASPMEHTLGPFIAAEFPLLTQMRSTVMCADSRPGFMTSDSPVIWYDPEGYKKPPLFSGPCFADPALEISLPLSPSQLLLLTHRRTPFDHLFAYLDVGANIVAELNRRTRFHCHGEYVLAEAANDAYWFDVGKPPHDAAGDDGVSNFEKH